MQRTQIKVFVLFVIALLLVTTILPLTLAKQSNNGNGQGNIQTIQVKQQEHVEQKTEMQLQKEDGLKLKNPLKAFLGYIEKEDGSDAAHLRIVTTNVRRNILLNEDLIQKIRNLKNSDLDKNTIKDEVEKLIEETKTQGIQKPIYIGTMWLGRGDNMEKYRILLKTDSSDDTTLSFYVLPINEETQKPGFFRSMGQSLGILKNPATEVSTEDLNNIIGELTVTKQGFETINIWKGTLELDDTSFQGNWDVNAFSALNLYWPNLNSETEQSTELE